MGIKTIPITNTTVIDPGSDQPPLGPTVMMMPEGPALCVDAESCTIITAERPASGEKFCVVISVADMDGERVGTMAQMTPTEARQFAASLIAGADECDGGMKGAN
jgi:hypothetical protein